MYGVRNGSNMTSAGIPDSSFPWRLADSTISSTTPYSNLSGNASEEPHPQLPAYIAYTSLSLCSLVLGIGVLGNVLVLVVILTSKSMRSSTNLFLLNLSIADLLVLVVCCPNGMIEMYMRRDIWLMGKAMCHLVPFIELAVSHTSVLTILAITVERYYAICLPLQAGMIWTKGKAGLVCILSWSLSVVLTSPVLAMATYKTSSPPTCSTDVDAPWTKVYFMTIISIFFWLPLIVLIILYSTIARQLTAKGPPNKHMGSSAAEKDMRSAEGAAVTRGRKQIVVMLGTVVTFFFACLLPFKVLTMWIVVSPVEVLDAIDSEVYFNLLYFSRLMFYINSAINPILYNTMSSRFRERFRRVFGCGRLVGKSRFWSYGGTQKSVSTSALTSSSRLSKSDKQIASCQSKTRKEKGKEFLIKQKNMGTKEFNVKVLEDRLEGREVSGLPTSAGVVSGVKRPETREGGKLVNPTSENRNNPEEENIRNRSDPKLEQIRNRGNPEQEKVRNGASVHSVHLVHQNSVNKLDSSGIVYRDTVQSIKQTRRKSSMLKVASILSFMHYIENTEETFL